MYGRPTSAQLSQLLCPRQPGVLVTADSKQKLTNECGVCPPQSGPVPGRTCAELAGVDASRKWSVAREGAGGAACSAAKHESTAGSRVGQDQSSGHSVSRGAARCLLRCLAAAWAAYWQGDCCGAFNCRQQERLFVALLRL